MHAAILSIGDELVLGQNVDTNTAWLAAALAERGVMAIEHRTVSDDRDSIARTFAELMQRVDVVISTGGLGPTDDDITRDALGDVLNPGRSLVVDDDAVQWLEQWFAGQGRAMPENNRRQTMRPDAARCLPNPHGTAPGLIAQADACLIAALPGPPREMRPMFNDHILPLLQVDPQRDSILTATVHAFGIGESDAAARLGALTDRARNPLIGTTVSDSIVSARVRAHGPPQEMQQQIDKDLGAIEQAWHPYAFGRNGAALPEMVGQLLRDAGKKLVTAESCTGGWLGKMIVDVPGSTAYYLGGWITYSNDMKTAALAVSHEVLEAHGAVSREVAQAMAAGALANNQAADYALAITGVAGPGGGTQAKPAGTVYIALATSEDDMLSSACRRFHFPGDRMAVRDRSAKAALQMLRLAILHSPDVPLLWEIRREAQMTAKVEQP